MRELSGHSVFFLWHYSKAPMTEESQDAQIATEAPQAVTEAKRERTEAQKLALEKARTKALAVRAENAALKKREAEVQKAHAAKETEMDMEMVRRARGGVRAAMHSSLQRASTSQPRPAALDPACSNDVYDEEYYYDE